MGHMSTIYITSYYIYSLLLYHKTASYVNNIYLPKSKEMYTHIPLYDISLIGGCHKVATHEGRTAKAAHFTSLLGEPMRSSVCLHSAQGLTSQFYGSLAYTRSHALGRKMIGTLSGFLWRKRELPVRCAGSIGGPLTRGAAEFGS